MTVVTYDAHLDPWCIVPLQDGTQILFGYALVHEATAGLAWTNSSELLELDIAVQRAVTRSGRRYQLGRRIDAVDIGGEGEEARLAFQLLIGPAFEEAGALSEVDRLWLMACKAARHLDVEPPTRTQSSTRDFFNRQAAAYVSIRRRSGS